MSQTTLAIRFWISRPISINTIEWFQEKVLGSVVSASWYARYGLIGNFSIVFMREPIINNSFPLSWVQNSDTLKRRIMVSAKAEITCQALLRSADAEVSDDLMLPWTIPYSNIVFCPKHGIRAQKSYFYFGHSCIYDRSNAKTRTVSGYHSLSCLGKASNLRIAFFRLHFAGS